jgi:ArsR family transcriptional regulator, arsenate/arsenite/antimonite-responsive transcriptional repressor / arsenate reductase (thioredoxin)
MVYFYQIRLKQFRLEETMQRVISTVQPPPLLKLLAHDIRWNILMLLARSDYCVQDLVHLVQRPHNLVSYHLRQLRGQHLVTERRSAADSRDMYYSLNFDTLHTLYFAAADALHPALSDTDTTFQEREVPFSENPIRILFLCTENSARSQIAEALMCSLSKGKVEAFSAGSHPSTIHPYALKVLAQHGIETSHLRSKHFDEFRGQTFDRIITLCDRVREVCPTFPGDPERIHWSFPNPAAVEGTEEERYRAFKQVAQQLTTRLRLLLILLERERGNKL